MARAWEIARMLKTMPYENRTIMSNLAKRPLKKLLVEDLKLHTVWAGFRTKPIEWFKEVEAGREVNPFDPKRPVKPYRPEPADGSSK